MYYIFIKIQKKKLKIARPDSSQNFMDRDGKNNQFDSCVCYTNNHYSSFFQSYQLAKKSKTKIMSTINRKY